MENLQNGWFHEKNSELWPGQCMSLEIEKVLHHEKSQFQDIIIAKSATYGNVLILDGVIQATERDEFSYQEMIAHVPIAAHPNPKKVLVIGGGDGGVLREIVKHDIVEEVTICEIDGRVIELSKQYLPSMAVGFSHPKVKTIVGDGFQYMRDNTGSFDVIITDSSDPFGPATTLFGETYYNLMKNALAPGGIVCAQGECVWLHLDMIADMVKFCKDIYKVVDYSYTCIPTYPSGQIGLLLCSLNPETDFRTPLRAFSEAELEAKSIRYYDADVHRASFVLPRFARKALNIQYKH
eukprot:Colp12_sorted_trinity150504_noHs@6893